MPTEWSLLIYKLPPHPTRLRLAVWRRLQALGCLYLQDGVCALPKRDDLHENLEYAAAQISESSGTFHLLSSTVTIQEEEKLIGRFRALADERMKAILARLADLESKISEIGSAKQLERVEEEL